MGIRSDVGVALTNQAMSLLKPENMNFLHSNADKVCQKSEGCLFIIEGIKWNDMYEDVGGFMADINNLEDDESYYIVEACFDYPDADNGFWGSWYDNPWGLTKYVTVQLAYDEPDDS